MTSERRKSRRFDSEKPASSRTGGIPVFGLVDLKKNRDFRLIKQDLEERGRMREKGPAGGPKEEVLYVDATRNVGVVLGKRRTSVALKNIKSIRRAGKHVIYVKRKLLNKTFSEFRVSHDDKNCCIAPMWTEIQRRQF